MLWAKLIVYLFQANIEGSLKLAPSRENTDAIIASKTMTRAAHRAALGDIGNKVSKMTIDASKKPIKKEIIQAAKGRTLQKNKATSSLKSADIEIYRVTMLKKCSVDFILILGPPL